MTLYIYDAAGNKAPATSEQQATARTDLGAASAADLAATSATATAAQAAAASAAAAAAAAQATATSAGAAAASAQTAATAAQATAAAAYVRPESGIPHADLHQGIRDQLDIAESALQPGVLPAGTTVTAAQVSDASAAGRSVLTAADEAAQRTALGLGNVNNTSDANKPVSTAQAAAIAAKMDATLPALQTVFDAGTAAQKAAFQSSVSGSWLAANPATANRILAPASTVGTQRIFAHTAGSATAGYTFARQDAAVDAFLAVRLVFANYANTAQTITSAKAAVSPTAGNDGTALSWVNVTFGGSASGTHPAATGGSASNVMPSLYYSDWIDLSSIPRTDFPGRSPLLYTRAHFAGASSQQQLFGSAMQDYAAAGLADSYEFASAITAGDAVSTISALVPAASGTWICPVGVEYLYSRPTVVVADVGDSLFAGQIGDTTSSGWRPVTDQACRLLRAERPGVIYSPASYAIRGQNTAASYVTAREVVSKQRPDFLVFKAWSPNDGAPTQTLMDAAWRRVLYLVEHCLSNGVQPVVVTSYPVNAYAASEIALLEAQNARVRALAPLVLVSDEGAAIADPANPGKINPAYLAGAGTHLNAAGYAAAAAVRAAVL